MTEKKDTAPAAGENAAPPPAAEPKAAKPAKKVKVRVLVDCSLGKCNDVVELDADAVASHGGEVDAHPSAVAYAEKLHADARRAAIPDAE